MARLARKEKEEAASSERSREAISLRVRVGVTGLAAVFLLTLLAASVFGLLGQDDRGVSRLANGTIVSNGASADNTPKEPLAELGVAPGNAPKPTTTGVTAAPSAGVAVTPMATHAVPTPAIQPGNAAPPIAFRPVASAPKPAPASPSHS